MEHRRRLGIILVVVGGLAAVILVGVLLGIGLNKSPSGPTNDGAKPPPPTNDEPLPPFDTEPPPPLPPLTDLPAGRGLDWSRAGFRDGWEALPSPPIKYNVLDFGARGDNVTDDSQALQAAVAAANADPDGGVVYLPAGSYVLRQELEITRSNVVLLGDGEGASTIYIPVSLADVYPGSWGTDASGGVWTQWAFGGAFIKFTGAKLRSSDGDTLLSAITGEVEQGAAVLPVDQPRRFSTGQRVRVYVNDESTGLPASAPEEGETGVALRQQAALAASTGTIADWVYGDGLADSGTGAVLHTDEISFTARVAAIGEDWVALDREMPFPVRRGWEGLVHSHEPSLQGAGMEALTIQFAHSLAGGHLTERGYNALEASWAASLFLRNVTFLNTDNGIKFTRVDHSTLSGITFGVTAPRWLPGDKNELNGHHAVSITEGHGNLLTRFNVTAPFFHDISLSGGAMLNVISDGGGADLNLDLHRAGPFGNLFSRLDLGLGSRPFKSGGREDRGAHAGRQTTFWNVGAPPRITDPPPPPPPSPPPPPPSPPPPSPPPKKPKAPKKQSEGASSRRLLGASSHSLELPQRGMQWQAMQRQRRQLLQDETPPVELPPCDFGPLLNFIGSYDVGDGCSGTGWLVQGLGEEAPSDLYRRQVVQRNATLATGRTL